MLLPDSDALADARRIVYRFMPPTPQYRWPLLCQRLGTDVWLKHENHTPTGAFKVRGGLVYFEHLAKGAARPRGVIAATRGNHGQSVAFAAAANGIASTIVVPHGNSREKNAAMRARGAQLVEYGDDFQAAREHAVALAGQGQLHMVPSYHPHLIAGVASYWLELLQAQPGLQRVYVPIGLGSGITAAVAARRALSLTFDIVGVVSSHAPTYARSLAAGKPIAADVTTVLADGLACRVPEPAALELLAGELADMVEVTDDEVRIAMKWLYLDTHNLAEGAGAAALAAAYRQRGSIAGQSVALVLSGGNVDHEMFAGALAMQG